MRKYSTLSESVVISLARCQFEIKLSGGLYQEVTTKGFEFGLQIWTEANFSRKKQTAAFLNVSKIPINIERKGGGLIDGLYFKPF